MMQKESCALILSALMLTACGGGGGGGAPALVRTNINGTVTPPATIAATGSVQLVPPAVPPAVPPTDMLLPTGTQTAAFPAIAQLMNYSYDPAALPSFKMTTLSISPVDPAASVSLETTLGQPTGISINAQWGVNLTTATGATVTQGPWAAGISSVDFTKILPGAIGTVFASYMMPYSATTNPSGYTYQTFGAWLAIPSANNFWEGWFSAGVPTATGTLPTIGTAGYTGQAVGTYINATTRDHYDTEATMNASADFAKLSVAFSTTGTVSQIRFSPTGTPWTPTPGLDMSGTLTYTAGNNTFTGTVNTFNGMSGNATGRFYGPAGIAPATGTKVAGAPPEIGGTFAVMNTAGGAMQGAFGGK